IAWVDLFSTFQRTHVTTNPVGLFLNYCIESRRGRGSGLCACSGWATKSEWPCATARQMGFKEEGEKRWTWVLLDGMEESERSIQDGDPESEG
ncbi:hypothetical protein BJV74DRAFT_774374, partial [Russula compacta]